MPITTTYYSPPPPLLDLSLNIHFQTSTVPLYMDVLRVSVGHFALGARCNRWKNSNYQCRCLEWTRATCMTGQHHPIAIKVGLYHKAVQMYHIPIITQCSSQAAPLCHSHIFSCFGAEKISSCAILAQKIYCNLSCRCVASGCFFLLFTINRHRNYFKMQRKL